MRAWSGSFWVVMVLTACGPKPEAKTPPSTIAAAPVVVEEPPDLSAVKRPAEVVVTGRIARPRALFDTVTQWSSLPLRLEDIIPAEARPLAGAVSWDAPVEMLVALDAFGEGKVPPPLAVGSVGLKSLQSALNAAEAMQLPTSKLRPGVYRVGDFSQTSCAIAVSVGAAPARLICGRSAKDVDVLLPYATRGLPSEPLTGADFEVTLDAKPVQQHYGRDVTSLRLLAGVGINQIALDSPRFDRALSDAVYGVVDEAINLFGDLEQIRFEAQLDSKRKVLMASSELRLTGDSSWTAGTIAAMKSAPLPEPLPRVPPEATLASYNTALPAERYAPLARVLGELGEGFLEHEKLPVATRKRFRNLTDSWVGNMPEGVMFAVSPSQADPLAYKHPDTVVMRVSEPAPRLLGLYTDMVGLLGDPALKRWLKQKAGSKVTDKMWPKASKRPLKLAGFKAPATLFELTIDMKAWSSSNEAFANGLRRLFEAEADDVKRVAVLVQPDGNFTYVITGDDLKEMSRVMAEHQKPEPGATIVKPARSDKVTMAGFATLAYVAHTLERSVKSREIGKALAAAPSHGKVPMPFSITARPGNARFDFEVPAAVFGDVSAAVVAGASSKKLK